MHHKRNDLDSRLRGNDNKNENDNKNVNDSKKAGAFLFSFLCSITTSALLSAVDTESVQDSSDDVITNTGQVSNSSAADQDDGVLLKIVVLAGNISRNLATIG